VLLQIITAQLIQRKYYLMRNFIEAWNMIVNLIKPRKKERKK